MDAAGLFLAWGCWVHISDAVPRFALLPCAYLKFPLVLVVVFQDKEHLEAGDKILLPSSALDALARQQVEYPMLFELSNPSQVGTAVAVVVVLGA